mgnify:CR=1 FL=1
MDLYESDLNDEWLEFAEKLQDLQNQYFWDETNGGYFSTTSSDSSVILRLKEGMFKYVSRYLSIKVFMAKLCIIHVTVIVALQLQRNQHSVVKLSITEIFIAVSLHPAELSSGSDRCVCDFSIRL